MRNGIQRTKLCEDVANRITENIRSQKWKAGSKIPSETALAESFEVSRATVRTAVKLLQLSGVLYSKAGSGTYVHENASAILESRELAAVMSEPHNVHELLQARFILEPQLCALAAQNATDIEIEQLFSILQDMEQCKDRHTLMAYGYQFHQAVADFSHNKILYGFCQSISSQLRGLRVLEKLTLDTFLKGIEEHRNIANAIKERNDSLARERMLEHLKQDYNSYLEKTNIFE